MKKKSLIMLLSAMLVIATAAMGTIAYLTDSKNITNTFTVGNVAIELDETVVDENGVPQDADNDGTNDRTYEGNDYRLVPGKTYTKDPTVTVKAGSEESYVRMILHITNRANVIEVFGEDFKVEDILKDYHPEVWVPVGRVDGEDIISYEFRYAQPVDTLEQTEDEVLAPLFTGFTVPGELKNEELAKLADMKIVVEGHAIQTATFTAADYIAEGITDEEAAKLAVDAAWNAFHAQYNSETII